MSVAIEAFVDSEQVGRQLGSSPTNEYLAEQYEGGYDATTLLHRFGEFLATLDIQPVTVPISSLVGHMMGTYAYVTNGLCPFSW